MGRPGNPAPEPTSATDSKAFTTEDTEEDWGKRWRAAKRLSPKWRVAMASGSPAGGQMIAEQRQQNCYGGESQSRAREDCGHGHDPDHAGQDHAVLDPACGSVTCEKAP